MSEANFWRALRPKLIDAELDPYRIESTTKSGIPDVNITTGWIELKFAPRWPQRDNSKLRLPGFSKEQKEWLLKRKTHGGKCWVVLRVGSSGGAETYIFDGEVAAKFLGNLSRKEMQEKALYWCQFLPPVNHLKTIFEEWTS